MNKVNTTKRGRPSKSGAPLSQARILEQARLLVKEQGKIPSIRALATSLGVDAMAIYYYYENKKALLEAITRSLIESLYVPQKEQPWEEALHQLALSYLELLHQYPGLLEILLSMTCDSPAEIFSQRFFVVVEKLSLTHEERKQALDLLVDYLHGFALAMTCQQGTALQVNHFEGAFNLYCRGIASLAEKS